MVRILFYPVSITDRCIDWASNYSDNDASAEERLFSDL